MSSKDGINSEKMADQVVTSSEITSIQDHSTKGSDTPIATHTDNQSPTSAIPLQSQPEKTVNNPSSSKTSKTSFLSSFPLSSIQWMNSSMMEKQTDNPEDVGTFKTLSNLPKEYWIAFSLMFLIALADSLDLITMSYSLQKIARYYNQTNGYMSQAITYSILQRTTAALSFSMFAGDVEGGGGGTLFANKHLKWFVVVDMAVLGSLQIAATYVKSIDLFLVVRVLFGLGTGSLWSTNALELIRFCPKHSRSIIFATFQCSMGFASILAAGLNTGFPNSEEADSWRPMFWVSAGILYLCAIIRFIIPDSKTQFNPLSQQHICPEREPGLTLKQRLRIVWTENVTKPWKHFRGMIKAHRWLVRYFALLMFVSNWYSFSINLNYVTFLIYGKEVSNHAASIIVIIIKSASVIGIITSGFLCQIFGPRQISILFGILSMALMPAAFLPFDSWALALGGSFFGFFSDGFIATLPILLSKYSPSQFSIMIPIIAYQLGGLFSSPSPQVANILADAIHFTRQDKSLQAWEYIFLTIGLVALFFCIIWIYFGPTHDDEEKLESTSALQNETQDRSNTPVLSQSKDDQVETMQASNS